MRRSSRGGRRPHHAAGFTLVELIVVVALIGLASTVVVLTMPDDQARLQREAERFAARLVHARQSAILGLRPIEVTVTAQGYGFTREDLGRWLPLREGPFRDTSWPQGLSPQLERRQPQVTFHFDPTGLSEERQLRLLGARQPLDIRTSGNGEVSVHAAR